MNAHIDPFADPMDFCRTCRGAGRLDDGLPCDMCGGHGAKTIAGACRATEMSIPQARAWRRQNPRCADCGAAENLVVVVEEYEPEPAMHRCADCLGRTRHGVET